VHGPEHHAFEREFADFLGGGTCIGVGNGTDALELALRGVTDMTGSFVVTAANAGGYAATAVRRAGLRVRYADVDETTMLLTADTVEAVLDDQVSVVIVTHLYGRLAEMDAIVELCRARGVAVLEDCAQAVGAEMSGRNAGTFGDVAAFSFYPTKNLGALGDAGAVVSSRTDVVDRVRRLRQYGWESKYEVHEDGGRNSRLDEVHAAVLRVRLRHVREWNAVRRRVIERYASASTEEHVHVLPASGPEHAAHLAVAVSNDRDRVRASLTAAGVQTDIHYPVPDHRQPAFAGEFAGVHLPVTEAASRRVFSLPCFPELTDDEIERVCDVLGRL
jgi:dTDP-4-amino-4,6-dideoxygalactose transaminase